MCLLWTRFGNKTEIPEKSRCLQQGTYLSDSLREVYPWHRLEGTAWWPRFDSDSAGL